MQGDFEDESKLLEKIRCDYCNCSIDYDNDAIFCVYKGKKDNPIDELTICTYCYQDTEILNDYKCDDDEID